MTNPSSSNGSSSHHDTHHDSNHHKSHSTLLQEFRPFVKPPTLVDPKLFGIDLQADSIYFRDGQTLEKRFTKKIEEVNQPLKPPRNDTLGIWQPRKIQQSIFPQGYKLLFPSVSSNIKHSNPQKKCKKWAYYSPTTLDDLKIISPSKSSTPKSGDQLDPGKLSVEPNGTLPLPSKIKKIIVSPTLPEQPFPHWRQVVSSQNLLPLDTQRHMFKQFPKKYLYKEPEQEILVYNDLEYKTFIHDTPLWTKVDTDKLFYFVQKYLLIWPVIVDRFISWKEEQLCLKQNGMGEMDSNDSDLDSHNSNNSYNSNDSNGQHSTSQSEQSDAPSSNHVFHGPPSEKTHLKILEKISTMIDINMEKMRKKRNIIGYPALILAKAAAKQMKMEQYVPFITKSEPIDVSSQTLFPITPIELSVDTALKQFNYQTILGRYHSIQRILLQIRTVSVAVESRTSSQQFCNSIALTVPSKRKQPSSSGHQSISEDTSYTSSEKLFYNYDFLIGRQIEREPLEVLLNRALNVDLSSFSSNEINPSPSTSAATTTTTTTTTTSNHSKKPNSDQKKNPLVNTSATPNFDRIKATGASPFKMPPNPPTHSPLLYHPEFIQPYDPEYQLFKHLSWKNFVNRPVSYFVFEKHVAKKVAQLAHNLIHGSFDQQSIHTLVQLPGPTMYPFVVPNPLLVVPPPEEQPEGFDPTVPVSFGDVKKPEIPDLVFNLVKNPKNPTPSQNLHRSISEQTAFLLSLTNQIRMRQNDLRILRIMRHRLLLSKRHQLVVPSPHNTSPLFHQNIHHFQHHPHETDSGLLPPDLDTHDASNSFSPLNIVNEQHYEAQRSRIMDPSSHGHHRRL